MNSTENELHELNIATWDGQDTLSNVLRHYDAADECADDVNQAVRHQWLLRESDARRGVGADGQSCVPQRLALEQGAERYFHLVRLGLASLARRFDEWELTQLLNANPSTVWDTSMCLDWMASAVADDQGIESIGQLREGPMKKLLSKLAELSAVENVALLDVCERVWRNLAQGSLASLCESMGLPLDMSAGQGRA